MFELVNKISDVEFIKVVSKESWRDELIAFGLSMDQRFFKVKGGIAPIYLAFADSHYTERFGNQPRITLSRGAENDRYFNAVCSQYNITPINNYGGTVEGYDFDSDKTAIELCSFLVGFENAYRKAKVA